MNHLFFEVLGTAGSLAFVLAGIPNAWKTWRQGHSTGVPVGTVWLFIAATILTAAYLFGIDGAHPPAILVSVEFIFWAIAAWYHYFPRPFKATVCTRKFGHQGVCNGYKREDCGTLPCEHDPVPAIEGGLWMCRECGIDLTTEEAQTILFG